MHCNFWCCLFCYRLIMLPSLASPGTDVSYRSRIFCCYWLDTTVTCHTEQWILQLIIKKNNSKKLPFLILCVICQMWEQMSVWHIVGFGSFSEVVLKFPCYSCHQIHFIFHCVTRQIKWLQTKLDTECWRIHKQFKNAFDLIWVSWAKISFMHHF